MRGFEFTPSPSGIVAMIARMPWLAAVCLLLITATHAWGDPPAAKDLDGDPLPPGAIARFGTLHWRPGLPCVALAYTPDGKQLLSADCINGCCVWDAAGGRKLRQFG